MRSAHAPISKSPQHRPPWAIALVLAIVAASATLLLWALGDPVGTAAFVAGLAGLGAVLWLSRPRAEEAPVAETRTDIALLRAAIDSADAPIAISDADGAMICANRAYEALLRDATPVIDDRLAAALAAARRDGVAILDPLEIGAVATVAELRPAGHDDAHVLWRFGRPGAVDLVREAERLLAGEAGHRIGAAGLMALIADGDGRLVAANPAFMTRATGRPDTPADEVALVDLLAIGDEGQIQFAIEGEAAGPLRIVQVPLADEGDGLSLFLLLDEPLGRFGQLGGDASTVNALLDSLPLGLALANVDGRFVYLNRAFRKAANLSEDAKPAYPGDLVVDEDKAAVSDAVRRFARGPSTSSDLPVRLRGGPDEPVALTVAGVRGLGEAAVILSLKDNKEADRLKRQIAQATKMQAVGQLAGGVAHDFNNILTAIIGYCDLMLMRHSPGDSDYDDIQQIKSNSNRAAGLTRHLLAFSRQQTLRPQVLQLPDIISEVSNLLKRLIGEGVRLEVKHDRNLGAVRADPGQLEQVIVNLAVNARDAIQAKGEGGGVLTLHTYSVSTEESRRLGIDILPLGEYTALKVSDTGAGIPHDIIGKIFEPFFTTKEVGKGTGLGLSTVYGIVKQSGGYIFAESVSGEGTSFIIYLPVHRAEAPAAVRAAAKQAAGDVWGTGTILLVEDEAMVRAVAERALTRHGYTVLAAENGEAALEILEREGEIDLMISDVMMPTMDGPTTAREARKTHPDMPILFISGYAEEQLRKSIDFDLEKVSFLAKPFSVHRLAEAARDAMQAK